MPKLNIEDYNIHYESYGSGEPIIFLSGILMSTISWHPFRKSFNDYNLILIDLIDQGQSSSANFQYDQNLQVEILYKVIEKLNIDKCHIVGISYGGEIALQFALKYPHKLNSIILSNTTCHNSNIMKDIKELWDFAASTYDGRILFKATMPYIYSHKFYEENIQWLKKKEEAFSIGLTKQWYSSFRRIAKSASNLNLTKEIKNISLPTMIIGSEYDILTPICYQKLIHKKIKGSRIVVIEKAGHAVIYEKPIEFIAAIKGFLESYNQDIKIL
ncbi:alpha/beta fold hydrolase [Clostridium sp. Marseille-Q7071]